MTKINNNTVYKGLYDDEPESRKKKVEDKKDEKSSKDLYNEIDYGVSFTDSVIYLH
jgi:hypothetical protein